MFFRRNEGQFRETDRVTRFKLIKSGKNWLRAATSNFGLFKVVKGGADAPSVSVQNVEEKTSLLSGQALLKGIAAAGAVAGGAVATYTAQAEETTAPALESQATTNHDVLANSESVALSAAPVSEAVASEAPSVASTSQESTSSSVDAQASTDASVSVSQSVSAELSQAISESVSLSKVNSTSESQSHTESNTGSNSESASESATSTAATASETATQENEKTILDQNVSEAELLVGIAKDYQAKLTDTAAKAEIQTAIATVQEEVVKSTTLLAASATNAAYAEQRERLGNAVDNMMTKITDNGFTGNSVVNGVAAVTAQLAPIATSNTLSAGVDATPGMDDANGATLTDKSTTIPAGYSADPASGRLTFGIWNLKSYNETYNTNYYVTLSVDKTTSTNNPDVYVRLVDKSTGNEVATTTLTSANSGKEVNLGNLSGNKYYPYFVYNASTNNGTSSSGAATVDVIIKNNAEKAFALKTEQVYDYLTPANQGESKPNVEIGVPSTKMNQTTHYKVVDTTSSTYDASRSSADTTTQSYKPTGNETELASYTQTGLQGQNYTASNPRSFEGYVLYQQADASTTSGELGSTVGAKFAELKGTRAHYYVKRIREVVANDGSTVTKIYVLDPSAVSTFNESVMANNTDTTGYTLVYTTPVIKSGEKYIPSATNMDTDKVVVNSKNGDYQLTVSPWHNPDKPDEGLVYITGWYAAGHVGEADYMYTTEPNGTANSTPGGNTQNAIGGRTKYALLADGKTIKTDASGNPVKTTGGFGNQFSIPSANEKPSGDTVHYYRKTDEKGSVYVHYRDTEGNEIKASVTDEKDQPVGKDYDTVVDNRPKEIEFQGKTYELVPAGNYKVGQVDEQGHWTGDDATTGKVVEGDKNVTYVYKLKEDPTKPKEGDVIITYVDEKGKEIKKPRQDTPNSPYDTPYNTTEEGEKPNTIKTPDGKTYKIVPKGDYPVGKVDGDGHLESSDPIKGKVDKPRSIITYVYKEVKGDVYVHYKDTEGNTIKTSVVDEKDQPVDKDYDTVVDNRPKTITTTDGKVYELVPAGNYTVGKVDGQGHLESSDATTGKVIEGRKDVTYIYKLKEQPAQPKGNVYVHYVDENGNTIKQSVTDEFGQPVGKDYDTVIDNRPKTIVTADGKVYELVPQGNYPVGSVDGDGHLTTTDPVTGKVIEGDKNVTYVYKLVDTTPEKPVTPTPGKPEQPTPGKPVDPAPKAPAKATPVKPAQEMAQLPNTGEESNVAATAALGLLATASGLALAAKRKKTEE